MTFGTMNAQQAHKEHVLAVSRDFISQPRLSKYILRMIRPIELGRVCAKNLELNIIIHLSFA